LPPDNSFFHCNEFIIIGPVQQTLRAELYAGLEDAIHDGDADVAGKKVILPATFCGGPRFMVQHYQDAMAIVRTFGKPTFFVTFTCNAGWEEITRELRPGQTATDRPDITSRVFWSDFVFHEKN
jgi:hypothetical protein